MNISKETLLAESNRAGFRAEILEKVIRLIDLLNAFSNDIFLKSRIALKGGTALNLFYFDLPRLSVDIDLNFISRVSLWKVTHLNSIQIGNYQANKIPVLDYYDLIGGKLSALFSRHKSRDLFDTYTIFTHSKKLDMEKMKCAFLIYGAASRTDIRKISLDHLNFDANELKNMLLPVLRNEEIKEAKNLKSWAKKLINICKENLSDIIAFNHNELDFLTNVIDHGKIIPELITKDKNIINAIHMHPVLLWKIINVKKYNNTRE